MTAEPPPTVTGNATLKATLPPLAEDVLSGKLLGPIPDAYRRYGICQSHSSAYRLAQCGALPTVRLGGRRLLDLVTLAEQLLPAHLWECYLAAQPTPDPSD